MDVGCSSRLLCLDKSKWLFQHMLQMQTSRMTQMIQTSNPYFPSFGFLGNDFSQR